MKKVVRKVTIFALLTLSFFVNPLSVNNVEADFLKVIAPAEIEQNKPFVIDLEISDKPDTTFALKARLGPNDGALTKGQTFDPESGVWLSDSVSWERFPKIKTDSEGHWQGQLTAKPGNNSSTGKNLLEVRLKNFTDNTTKDSDSYLLTITEPVKIPEAPKVETKGEPILNEFFAAGGPEWVEIKNKGEGKIDLSGWLIDDEEGKSSPFVIPSGIILESGQFYVANFPSPKLNDITDSVRLLKPDNTLVEEYRYNSPEKGQSFAKDSTGNWFMTAELTPGTNNPNPPVISPTQTTTNPTVLAETTNSETDEVPDTSLPKLLESTESAKIATVSGSFKDPNKSNTLFRYLPVILGGFLIVLAVGIVGKNIYFGYKVKQASQKA